MTGKVTRHFSTSRVDMAEGLFQRVLHESHVTLATSSSSSFMIPLLSVMAARQENNPAEASIPEGEGKGRTRPPRSFQTLVGNFGLMHPIMTYLNCVKNFRE